MTDASLSKNEAISHRALAMQNLIIIEGEVFAAKDIQSLKHIAVNRPRTLIKTGHILWITQRGQTIKLDAISSQSSIDETTPFSQWMKRQVAHHIGPKKHNNIIQWTFDNADDDNSFSYPFTHALYAPFLSRPNSGGLLFTRDRDFNPSEIAIIKRLSRLFGMSALALGRKTRPHLNLKKRTVMAGVSALLILAAFIPVPMTHLAPAEIVADQPYMITAPIDGVIKSILVPPNSIIKKDTPLISFVDTSYRNDLNIAKQAEAVADAKLRQASLSSIIDPESRRETTIARAEKALAAAEQKYAQTRLSKTTLTAPKNGLALYTDPSDWMGRPVKTGETIIQIADPSHIILRIKAPLNAGSALNAGARVRLFLDSDPLNPIEAELLTASYYAQTEPDAPSSFEAFAKIIRHDDESLPRIGTRGVAKIYGDTASLGYWVLRRPLTILRQFFGF